VSRTAQQIWAQSKFQKSALEMLEYMEWKQWTRLKYLEIYMIGLWYDRIIIGYDESGNSTNEPVTF
jgi:hypothetical protein